MSQTTHRDELERCRTALVRAVNRMHTLRNKHTNDVDAEISARNARRELGDKLVTPREILINNRCNDDPRYRDAVSDVKFFAAQSTVFGLGALIERESHAITQRETIITQNERIIALLEQLASSDD